MASGAVNNVPIILDFDKIQIFKNSTSNTFIIRGYYNTSNYLQIVFNGADHEVNLSRMENGQPEEKILVIQTS